MKEPGPDQRDSSNWKDASHASGEVKVRALSSRSTLTPKDLGVVPVSPSTVRHVIETQHYLRSMPAACVACFGVFAGGQLMGAVVLTPGARQGYKLLSAGRPDHFVTLARLWLTDELPRNSESRVLSIVTRHLRRHTRYRLCLTYADPAAGHTGTIYRAAGWLYLGPTGPGGYIELADGQLHHPRTIFTQFGTNRVNHLLATGVAARRQRIGGKHRYACVLDPSWRWRLRPDPQPYPVVRERGPPAVDRP